MAKRKKGRTAVRARFEKAVIPTFPIGKGSPSPAIFELEENRQAYPRPVLDISTRPRKPVRRAYKLAVLESDLMRVEVLPEVGGRVWRIIDKTSGRNLLWTNKVIKPVDVGRRHGWIESGIEWPFPVSNHGEDTLEPYRVAMRQNSDGSATVTVWHFDHFYGFWGSYGVTVEPGVARVALTVRLYNPTSVRNRYQIWVNAAVPAGDDMRFIFPVEYVAGHGFAGVHPWPMMAEGKYDHSVWKNSRDMFGCFGWGADFLGAYYRKGDRATVRYCPHAQAEGIKMWTWGTVSHWTAEYTENQEPAVEIQWGRWPTQHMYGWLEPHQTDTWTEWWLPVAGLGGRVDAVSKDAAMSVEIAATGRTPKSAQVRINVVREIRGTLSVNAGGRTLLSKEVSLPVGGLLKERVSLRGLKPGDSLVIALLDADGKTVIAHEGPIVKRPGPKPEEPESVKVAGKGPQWEEFAAALESELLEGNLVRARERYELLARKRDDFAPAWKALGILLYKQLDSEGARKALARAVELAPADSEARWYLALAQGEVGDAAARETLKTLGGDAAYAPLASFALGVGAMAAARYGEALEHFEAATRSRRDPIALDYLAAAARLSGDAGKAREAIEAALESEPLDPFAAVEKLLADGKFTDKSICAALGPDSDVYMEVAFFYDRAGQPQTALDAARAGKARAFSALYYYQLAYLASRAGDKRAAKGYIEDADRMGPDYVFPHRREDYRVLEFASKESGNSGMARHHKATFLYWLGRQDEAMRLWQDLAAHYDVPGLRRLLAEAVARGKVAGAIDEAIGLYRKAIEENPSDAEAYSALDDLYEKAGTIHERRDLLSRARQILPEDDQIALRMARYWSGYREFHRAAEIIETHKFQRRHQSWRMLVLAQRTVEATYAGLAARALESGRRKKALVYLAKMAKARDIVRDWFD